MGVVDPPSDLMDLRSVNLGAEKYRCKSNPPAGEESFHLEEDDGVGVPGTDLNGLDVSGENFASDSNPRRRARNGTPTKGRWGWCR
jgi:hypothetical protein